jgi:hypothetical protein
VKASLASKRASLETFFTFSGEENPLLKQLVRKDFIHGLAYLADIFNHVKELYLSIQGP